MPASLKDDFTFHVPTRVHFGPGQLDRLGGELAALGRTCLLVYGSPRIRSTQAFAGILRQAGENGVAIVEAGGVEPNPRHTTVNRMAALCREKGVDVVLAVGGGSVIDCAKFVCAAVHYDGDAWDFFTGRAKMERFLPLVAVPTLAGTGSDMDAFGIVSNTETHDKIPLFHEGLFPAVTVLDPTLTYTVSPFQTACGAIDAFTHYLEVYFMRPNLDVHLRVMEGFMKALLTALPRTLENPEDYEARASIMWASSWALNGFTFGPTHGVPFACHWIEDELSAKYDMTHGLGLAILLPHYMEYCLSERTAPVYRELAVNVLGLDGDLAPMDAARAAIEALRALFFRTCGLKSRLRDCGVEDDSRFAEMADIAVRGGTIHGMRDLTADDVVAIFKMAF